MSDIELHRVLDLSVPSLDATGIGTKLSRGLPGGEEGSGIDCGTTGGGSMSIVGLIDPRLLYNVEGRLVSLTGRSGRPIEVAVVVDVADFMSWFS